MMAGDTMNGRRLCYNIELLEGRTLVLLVKEHANSRCHRWDINRKCSISFLFTLFGYLGLNEPRHLRVHDGNCRSCLSGNCMPAIRDSYKRHVV